MRWSLLLPLGKSGHDSGTPAFALVKAILVVCGTPSQPSQKPHLTCGFAVIFAAFQSRNPVFAHLCGNHD